MKDLKEKNKKRIISQILTIIIATAIYFILIYNKNNIVGDSYFNAIVLGYLTGLFFSLQAVVIYYLIKYISANKNEKKLKEIYIEENDERKILIEQKTESFSMKISYTVLAFASLVAAFYNELIFFSLIATILFLALVKIFSYLYFNHKY